MEKPHLEGIVLMSKKEIESEQEKLAARNLLQFAYAQKLHFLDQDEGASFEEFVFKYGKAIGDMIADHPEILNSYQTLLQEGRQDEFDFNVFKDYLKPYLPTIH